MTPVVLMSFSYYDVVVLQSVRFTVRHVMMMVMGKWSVHFAMQITHSMVMPVEVRSYFNAVIYYCELEIDLPFTQ